VPIVVDFHLIAMEADYVLLCLPPGLAVAEVTRIRPSSAVLLSRKRRGNTGSMINPAVRCLSTTRRSRPNLFDDLGVHEMSIPGSGL
jgi:hypothetical protein